MKVILGQEKPSIEDLAHFGVVGMKWGVRRSEKKTGVGRVRAAAAQSLQDSARRRRSASKNSFRNALNNVARVHLRTKKGNRKTAAKQEAAAKRILAGQTTVRDFLRASGHLNLLDLGITTTPITNNNRG